MNYSDHLETETTHLHKRLAEINEVLQSASTEVDEVYYCADVRELILEELDDCYHGNCH